jgi:endogenous inhibitor of DNA gyrase (YacG/DUF329 family)
MTLHKTDIATNIETKRRPCLKCGKAFESAWRGERVCPRCKSTSAWRNASGVSPASGRN